MILVALHHADHTVNIRIFPFRIVACPVPVSGGSEPVTFQISLLEDVDAVVITEVIESWVVWIVRCADGVHVVAFHDENILDHGFQRNRFAEIRMMIVTIHAFDHYRNAVDQHVTVFQLHRAESDFAAFNLYYASVLIFQSDKQIIQIWILRNYMKD